MGGLQAAPGLCAGIMNERDKYEAFTEGSAGIVVAVMKSTQASVSLALCPLYCARLRIIEIVQGIIAMKGLR
jgi:hypothetical protein